MDAPDILADLARARCTFQLRAIEAVMGVPSERVERVIRMGEQARRLNAEAGANNPRSNGRYLTDECIPNDRIPGEPVKESTK